MEAAIDSRLFLYPKARKGAYLCNNRCKDKRKTRYFVSFMHFCLVFRQN